jgi:hypothetical protein
MILVRVILVRDDSSARSSQKRREELPEEQLQISRLRLPHKAGQTSPQHDNFFRAEPILGETILDRRRSKHKGRPP